MSVCFGLTGRGEEPLGCSQPKTDYAEMKNKERESVKRREEASQPGVLAAAG